MLTTNQKTTNENDTEIDYKVKVLLSIKSNILMNNYANENVLFGRIKALDKIPIYQYLEQLGFRNIEKYIDDLLLDGNNIKNGYVLERDFNDRCFELYKDKIDYIFYKVPLDKSAETNYEDIYHYKYGLYDYIKSIYPLFKEIISTEITPDFFATIPDIIDEETKFLYYEKVTKFILAIKLKGLRQGRRIDRYVKDLPHISPLIMRLIKKHKGHYYLTNNDISSIDYKLALLSCFRFYNEENHKIFELKIEHWYNSKCQQKQSD